MKRFFLTLISVLAVSAMFVSCNKDGNGTETGGETYMLFFNFGPDAEYGSDTPVLNQILDEANKLTYEADKAIYGGSSETGFPFRKAFTAKDDASAKAEFEKYLDKAKSEAETIIAALNKIKNDNAEAIASYPSSAHVTLEFAFMLLKSDPEILGGKVIHETDCGTFSVKGGK